MRAMFSEEINKLSSAAEKKAAFLKNNKGKYIVSSAMAGMFVGFGILLIFTIGGLLSPINSPATRIVMGLSFGIALSLVLMVGAELFTGNNMIMTVGILEKRVTLMDSIKIWIYSYIGNFIGGIVLAVIFVQSGLAKGGTADFILNIAQGKMNASFMELFFRGILCNMLVCLAIWCSFKLKEETSKLIMIFWCLFAFITSGFEHSIANMTLFSVALTIPHEAGVSMTGLINNLTAVSLGNFVGGAIFVGAAFWYISQQKKELSSSSKITKIS
jgi:nitrite transporter